MKKYILLVLLLAVVALPVYAEEAPVETPKDSTTSVEVKSEKSVKIPSNDVVFVRELDTYRSSVNMFIDVGTSAGIGFDNYKKSKNSALGYSFGINKSFLKGDTDYCSFYYFMKSTTKVNFCKTDAPQKELRFNVSNDFFVNLGIQANDKNEIGILLGRDTYKPSLIVFKEETAAALGFYYKRYFTKNIGIKMGFLFSNINQVRLIEGVTLDSQSSFDILKNPIEKDKLEYKRADVTLTFRF
ncbi:MAG: hypothetical protein LBG48_02055 [Rickettsiales bacterium]|jgi:hypothetical protein|nr:hypothetical protein [Rickettsiales bacterium]